MPAHLIRFLATGIVIIYTLFLITTKIFEFPSGVYYWLWGMPGITLNMVSAYFLIKSLQQNPKDVDTRLSTFVASVAGTLTMALSATFISYPIAEFTFVESVRSIGGGLALIPYPFILWAYLCLRNNLTIIPEAHSVVAHGIYAYSRHPLYVCYMIWDIANVMMFPSLPILVLSILHIAFLFIRIRREEQLLLATFPGYRKYYEETGLIGKRFRFHQEKLA
jgi:protein-S-isoprenylcysteine O-methyltransferase Ste14